MGYLLLTGGTGLLGRYLLRDLTLADVPLAVLARRTRFESAAGRIESAMARWEDASGRALARPVVLEGDIAEQGFGLSAADLAWVTANCSQILHSAASLTFVAEAAEGEPWRSNVEGTRHMIDLCRQAGIRECHHVSTAYVCGGRRGRILESELDVGQQPVNDYERSKLTAETEVLAAECFDSVTIYRPSIIVGDSETGFTSSFHGFYTPLRVAHSLLQSFPWEILIRDGILGGIDLAGDEHKNLVPVEWVSEAITRVLTRPECHRKTYHLTSPNPTTVVEMQAAIGEVLIDVALSGKAGDGQGKPNATGETAGFLASFREQMKVYESYWRDDPQFDSSQTEAALPDFPCPEITHDVMLRLARWAVEANFGWPREMPIVPEFEVGEQLSRWLPGSPDWKSAGGDGGALIAGTRPGQDGGALKYVNLQVTGRGGGQWHLVLDRGRLTAAGVGLRSGASPICYLTSATFADLVHGGLTWDDSIRRGRLVVAGNSVHPWELARAFRLLAADGATNHSLTATFR